MSDNDIQYGDNSLRVREHFSSKWKSEMNKGIADNGLRLLKFIEKIPNWETYLTQKQLEVARKYITCMNAQEVDHQLKLNYGTTQQRLFGSSKTSRGALGKLESVANRLEQSGYFERIEKRKEASETKARRTILTEEVLNKTRELIRLIVEIPDYDQHLDKKRSDMIVQFISLRSFVDTAKHFSVKESVIQDVLLNDILNKLKEVAQQTMVSSWEDI